MPRWTAPKPALVRWHSLRHPMLPRRAATEAGEIEGEAGSVRLEPATAIMNTFMGHEESETEVEEEGL